jgi:hypothetical protein
LGAQAFPDLGAGGRAIVVCDYLQRFVRIGAVRGPRMKRSVGRWADCINLVGALPELAYGGELERWLGGGALRGGGGLLGYRHGDAVITLFIGTWFLGLNPNWALELHACVDAKKPLTRFRLAA